MILPRIGRINHPPRGGPPPETGGEMTVVVAAIGEVMTGGISAGGRRIARREPLPVEMSRVRLNP